MSHAEHLQCSWHAPALRRFRIRTYWSFPWKTMEREKKEGGRHGEHLREGGPEQVAHGSCPRHQAPLLPELLPVTSVSLRNTKGRLDHQRHKCSGGFVQQRKPSWLLGKNLPVVEVQVLFSPTSLCTLGIVPAIPSAAFLRGIVPQTSRSESFCLLQAAFPDHSSLQESLLSPTGLTSAGSMCPWKSGQPEF